MYNGPHMSVKVDVDVLVGSKLTCVPKDLVDVLLMFVDCTIMYLKLCLEGRNCCNQLSKPQDMVVCLLL